MAGAARASQADVHESQSGRRQGNEKDKQDAARSWLSVSLGTGMGIIFSPLAGSDAIGKRGRIPSLDGDPGQDKRAPQ